MDTHIKPWGEDLVRAAALVDERGREYPPLSWQGDAPGGHHRKGSLRFLSPPETSRIIELQLVRDRRKRQAHLPMAAQLTRLLDMSACECMMSLIQTHDGTLPQVACFDTAFHPHQYWHSCLPFPVKSPNAAFIATVFMDCRMSILRPPCPSSILQLPPDTRLFGVLATGQVRVARMR
jgi:hypothetical protein